MATNMIAEHSGKTYIKGEVDKYYQWHLETVRAKHQIALLIEFCCCWKCGYLGQEKVLRFSSTINLYCWLRACAGIIMAILVVYKAFPETYAFTMQKRFVTLFQAWKFVFLCFMIYLFSKHLIVGLLFCGHTYGRKNEKIFGIKNF